MEYTVSYHTEYNLKVRQIPVGLLENVLFQPQQILPNYEVGTRIYQSKFIDSKNKEYLIRLVVAERKPLHVITIYKTSKVLKYWRIDNEN